MPDDRTAVYRAYGAAGELLYVGIAGNWGRRWAQHSEKSAFFALVSRLEMEWVGSRTEALALESRLIRKHSPQFNVRGRGRDRPEIRPDINQPLLIGVCEACRREPAYSFSWTPDKARWYAAFSGTWRATGECTSDTEHYYITFNRWVTERDWLRHLRGKTWFDENDFALTVNRTRSPVLVASLQSQTPGRWK